MKKDFKSTFTLIKEKIVLNIREFLTDVVIRDIFFIALQELKVGITLSFMCFVSISCEDKFYCELFIDKI